MPDSKPQQDWAKKKADAVAEKEALEAERALLEAKNSLEAVKAPPVPPQQTETEKSAAAAEAAKKTADARKAAADARKAAADAEKAESEAGAAALKARLGTAPDSGFGGDVTVGERAGATEAALLAAKALEDGATRVKGALKKKIAGRQVFLYSLEDVPDFQALTAFRAQIAGVEKSFADAQSASESADSRAPEAAGIELAVVPVAAAGLALDSVNKLLGFFRTDFTVAGIELTLADSMLLHALAGPLADVDGTTIQLPAVYDPDSLSAAGSAILDKFTELSHSRSDTQALMDRHGATQKRFAAEATEESDKYKKQKLEASAKYHKDAVEAASRAVQLFDDFSTKLMADDDKGQRPMTAVVRQGVLAKALAGGALLLAVKLDQSGGACYTKKNLLSTLGRTPFFHMGGVVVSFLLLDGPSGSAVASGVVPVHGGFVTAKGLRAHLGQSSSKSSSSSAVTKLFSRIKKWRRNQSDD